MRHKTVAIIQARMASTRLPGKVLLPMTGKPALQWCVERVRKARLVDQVVVATTYNSIDILKFCIQEIKPFCKVYLGSEEDVLGRVYETAKEYKADYIVDLTADCPFVDPEQIDSIIEAVTKGNYSYGSNIWPRVWPDGFDIQVYPFFMLELINKLVKDPIKRHHVGWNIQDRLTDLLELKIFSSKYFIRCYQLHSMKNYSKLECTLDTKQDLMIMNRMLTYFYKRAIEETFTVQDVIGWLLDHPQRKQERNIPGEG